MKDDNLWVWFSRYVRLRDSNETGICRCFTCGAMHEWNDGGIQAGHFISRRHLATKYDEKNVHAQCVNCNHFQSGRQFEYGIQLDKVYGVGTAEKLLSMSRVLCKRNDNDIKFMTKFYRDKARELMKQKGTKYY